MLDFFPLLLGILLFRVKQIEAMAPSSISTTTRLEDVTYYLHPAVLPPGASLNVSGNARPADPCTLLTITDHPFDEARILETFQEFQRDDDVWSKHFASCVILQTTNLDASCVGESMAVLNKMGVRDVCILRAPSESAMLPHGPYFVHYGHLHQAYRLYPDTSGAFIVSVIPANDQNTFRSLDASAYGEQYPSALTVAVPSKLYYRKSPEKPYAGMRLGIKDIIDLKGLKTGASSRAYTELYPVKSKNADVVQQMIDLGFVIVGKLKTTQFADSEWPTCDWVDYHGPFNPRGDGYLTPSGSSAGSASAVASYNWLDFTLGSDTLGSIRSPSAAQGLFGMRPSLGAVSTKGIVPYSANWDTIGGFARTAEEFKILAQALYDPRGTTKGPFKNPTKLLYPTDYWPVKHKASQDLFESILCRMEEFLDVKRTPINLADTWLQTRPKGADGSLSEYFNHVFEWSANPDQWANLLKPFTQEYEEKMGKAPVLNPQLRFKLGYLPTVSEEQHQEGLERLKVYSDWFYEYVMPPSQDGYSTTIMVLPWTTGEPDYRDTYKDGPQQFTGAGFFFYNVGPYAQCPELIFPAGSTPYVSKFTGKTEYQPAALGVIGAKGSDIMLSDFIFKLFREKNTVGIKANMEQVPLS